MVRATRKMGNSFAHPAFSILPRDFPFRLCHYPIMANKNQGGLGGYAAVALIAFMVGRATGDNPAPAPSATESSAAQLLPTVDADSDNITEPVEDETADEQPQQAVVPAPRRYSPPEPVNFAEPVGTTHVYFSNCSAARAAGAAPVRAGNPGYAPHLDRDHDGVGCE
jgi:Excalibur calcium-binding domain